MLKNIFRVGIALHLFVLIAFSASAVMAQPDIPRAQESPGPNFHFDVINFASPVDLQTSRLYLYIQVVFDELQFVKMTDGFEANYEVSAVIYDDDDYQVDGKSWKESMGAENYDMTNRRNRYSQSYQTFDLPPGEYNITITIQDLETRLSTIRKAKVELRDFSQPKLMLSDIGLVSQIITDSTGVRAIRPEVTDASKGVMDSTYTFFEIYNPENYDKVTIEYEIYATTLKTRIRKSYEKKLTGFRTLDYFMLHADSLSHDLYNLTVKAQHNDDSYKVKKNFYVRWSALPTSARDLDTAIDQVRYIATKDEWKRLKKSKGEQRQKEFLAFWQRHDPTPGTEANEAMDEHYARVEYANQHFSGMQRAGWRTDMGIIYIILGAPDDIDRNAYPRASKPYEIWYYYRYNRQFLFYDYTGFGDYRLETPYSIYEFQRLLNN
ncbi:GWxTD domain-containing protein [candidate division KSB1 bacterium]|nr:GWxTD domain-containing protein [candidate division KSB1 bacterium]